MLYLVLFSKQFSRKNDVRKGLFSRKVYWEQAFCPNLEPSLTAFGENYDVWRDRGGDQSTLLKIWGLKNNQRVCDVCR